VVGRPGSPAHRPHHWIALSDPGMASTGAHPLLHLLANARPSHTTLRLDAACGAFAPQSPIRI